MDRVLKRVGLSKRTQSENDTRVTATSGDNVKNRRRRRSKSRRRPSAADSNKKSRGIFNIDWDSVKDCKSCKSRAITKRFCSKRADNELYRSNSFKFERFIRNSDDLSPVKRKISLCEDYSLPVDHLAQLAKKRPNSIAVSNNCFISQNFSELIISSPEEEQVVVLDTYSTPRDSQQQLTQEDNETKCFTSPDKEYSQPYTTEESSNPTSDEEFAYPSASKQDPLNLNSPDSINECTALAPCTILDVLSPNKTESANAKRHPSPYYYGDLFKYKTAETSSPPKKNSIRRNQSLKQQEKSESTRRTKSTRKHRRSTGDGGEFLLYKEKTLRSKQQLRHKKSSSLDSHSTDSRDASNGSNQPQLQLQMPPNHSLNVSTAFEDGLDDMTRQRHVYETAFDCRISKSDDDLDQIDKVSNHPVLIQIDTAWGSQIGVQSPKEGSVKAKLKEPKEKPSQSQEDNNQVTTLSQDLQNMHLAKDDTASPSAGLLMRGYTPSPPSTAPLPSKFPGKELMMNSIRSAPNLPSKSRHKDLNLPVKSLRGKSPTASSASLQLRQGSAFDIEFGSSSNSKSISEFKGRPGNSRVQNQENERISEIKSRPKRDLLILPVRSKDGLIRRIRHKYSSSESITTSSSGGSMESIKSSTSEGNRSTSSSESRQSASLSSHSSDSGGNRPQSYTTAQGNFLIQQQVNNKLHILSPISDKSSQEPISETSDNNKNNNSQKCSPESTVKPSVTNTEAKFKKRFPQNKNLLSLSLHDRPEIQGSDSGISIQSREGVKSRFGFLTVDLSAHPSQHDFSDLPFDMPKLRRRRIVPEVACTSGSATSVDLRDLPFDMPKLRRRMRLQTGNLEDSASQASSSQSVVEGTRRPKLTLNLSDAGLRQRPGLGITLTGIGLNIANDGASTSQYNPTTFTMCDNVIDANQPLEKQGWFHGSISRVEAENVLRALREGSFLVRNSESIKNDYSLSLKSARGFMHMRIQKNGVDGCFILGQFSKPFSSIPEMIKHFSMNRLPIRGAEHMCLLQPVIAQLL
ncbi:uncharacterized protein LOC132708743 isoform X2 [Cylas formicarius]|uniref:uncharacterized protein LOC132708743 isoform X2 n=1 Tax=Cylas formicarius TaxID=197179 RepID=UPI002958361B|nr:uncharacterized protein LOC132708743 isoform X2 [Cylas formicarius]